MKTILSLLGLIAIANAQSGYVRTSDQTPCPTVHGNDARLESEGACRDAANTLGIPFASLAGSEWQDGCIVNDDHAYWVPIGSGDDVQTSIHDGGSICIGEGNSGLRHARQWCGPHGGYYGTSLNTFDDCKNAAAELGFGFHDDVDWIDQNWFSGCITQPHMNDGKGHKAFFVPYDSNFATNGHHHRETERHFNSHHLMGGYICANPRYNLKTPEPVVPTPEPGPTCKCKSPQLCKSETEDDGWFGTPCADKAGPFGLVGNNHKRKNWCRLTSNWGKRCSIWCCENPTV